MQDGTTKVAGVVLPSSPVGRERGTVMDLLMEVNMTAMPAVRETSCVAATTVSNSGSFIIRKMTAVRNPRIPRLNKKFPSIPSRTASTRHTSDLLVSR